MQGGKELKKGFIIALLGIYFILSGCQENNSSNKDLSGTAIIAKEYLEEQGYDVLSYEEQQESYKLTERKIKTMPYIFYWDMPGNDPTLHKGKVVDVEEFIVKNHPLDNWECCGGVKSKGKVYTYVYVIEGEVVGGTSFPYGVEDAGLTGGYWSLDGRTEE